MKVVAVCLLLLALPASALGHAERHAYYPDRYVGAVPRPSGKGPALVVCKPQSRALVRKLFKGRSRKAKRLRAQRLALLRKCRYRDIQAAVDHASSGYRILIMPGLYQELPSRAVPVKDPKCADDQYWESSGDNHQEDGRVPTFDHQADCPNARNLIAVVGDTLLDPDRACDHRCNLQFRGMGKTPADVVIEGDRLKPDVFRADRADGFQISDLTIEQGSYNGLDVVETNGFRIERVVTRYNQNYGILTFTSDHGLYDHAVAYGNGDSGLYPGSGPEYHCDGYGIEIRNSEAYENMLGASGTAGNGTWTHDSAFHDNGAGIANDSFAPGHPGMPQDCSKWTGNRIYSNNHNYYVEHVQECDDRVTPFEKRPKELVCPQFEAVIGTGFMFYGVNDNVIAGNRIWDQWRNAIRMFQVPAALRGEYDAAKQTDTSHDNHFLHNFFGLRPDGTRDRNGIDVFWSEQGMRNCWQDSVVPPGATVTSDPATLPTCTAGGSQDMVGNQVKLATEVPCATWNPQTMPNPPGCIWMTSPADPGDGRRSARPSRFADAVTRFAAAPVSAPLTWAAAPAVYAPPELPADRIMVGTVRNVGSAELRLDALHARILGGAGDELPSTAHFAAGFTHGIYSPRVRFNEAEPEFLARRIGDLGVIAPGASAPLVVSWRGAGAATVVFGDVRLPLR